MPVDMRVVIADRDSVMTDEEGSALLLPCDTGKMDPPNPTLRICKDSIEFHEKTPLLSNGFDSSKPVYVDSDSDCSYYDSSDEEFSIDSVRAKQVLHRMRVLTSFAAIGGFLSGYNTGVISGALLPLKRVFHLSAEQEEAIVSVTIFAAFLSSLVGGSVNQVLGRRNSILSAAAVFTVGGLVMFCAQNYATLLIGEILLGIGIGMESLTSPMYIAEVAKPSIRGMLVSAYALMMCVGQFSAGIIDGIFGAFEGGWRFMFGMACVPGLVMFIGFLTLPESPAWLMAAGREEEAEVVLQSVRDCDEDVRSEIIKIRQSIRSVTHQAEKESVWRTFIQMMNNQSTRSALIVGCGVMVLQQICGVNGVLYYAASIYEMAGFEELTAIWLSAFTAFAQIIGLAISVYLVETAGRRILIITSFLLVSLCSMGLGFAFYLARVDSDPVFPEFIDPECYSQPALVWDGVTKVCYDCASIPGCGYCNNACMKGTVAGPDQLSPFATNNSTNPICSVEDGDEWHFKLCDNKHGYLSVIFMVLYLIVFGTGAAALPWTINSEIYPVKYRSLAVSISTCTNWLSNLLVSSTFLTINSPRVLTTYGSFWMYGVICLVGACWLYFVLPETKGIPLEEVEKAFSYDKEDSKCKPCFCCCCFFCCCPFQEKTDKSLATTIKCQDSEDQDLSGNTETVFQINKLRHS